MKLAKGILIFLLIINLTAVGFIGYLSYGIVNLLTWQVMKTDIYGEHLNNQVKELVEIVGKSLKKIDIYEKHLNSQVSELKEDVEKLSFKTDASIIKQANVLIHNLTIGVTGSGTHIKINGQSYILTVAHLTDYQDDELIAVLDNEEEYSLFLIKIDVDNDLALYKINLEIDLSHVEIAEEFPKEGSEIVLIGNPDDLVDVITNGVIAKIEENNYYVTNKGFYGSSGGGILYRDELIGVLSKIGTLGRRRNNFFPLLVNFGWSINLQKIHNFLEGVE